MFLDEVYSIASFLTKNNEGKEFYYDDVPKDFKTPSMYFPFPELVDSTKDTLDSYTNSYQLFVNIFENTTTEAMKVAFNLAQIIQENNYKIPLVNSEGVSLEKRLTLNKITTNKVDLGISQIMIQWNTVYLFDAKDNVKIQNFIMDLNNKS